MAKLALKVSDEGKKQSLQNLKDDGARVAKIGKGIFGLGKSAVGGIGDGIGKLKIRIPSIRLPQRKPRPEPVYVESVVEEDQPAAREPYVPKKTRVPVWQRTVDPEGEPEVSTAEAEASEREEIRNQEREAREAEEKPEKVNLFKRLFTRRNRGKTMNESSDDGPVGTSGGPSAVKDFISNQGKWILLVLGLIGVAAILYFKAPSFGSISGVKFSGPGFANFTIRFSELALIITGLLSFIEANDRNDPLLLDWWLALVEWGFLVYAGIAGLTPWSIFFAGIGLGGLIVGTFWNRGEETEKNLWNRWDTSGIFTLSFALIITYLAKWQSVPYPSFIPIIVVYLVAAFSLFKELTRSGKEFIFGLAVLLFGGIAGFYLTWTVIAITGAITIVLIYVASWQEWIPTNTARRSTSNPSIGPMKLKIIKAWDVSFAWWAAFVIIAVQFHQNFPLIILGK